MSEEGMVAETVEVGGQAMTLADMMGFDATDIAEVRRVKFPKGLYLFEVSVDAKMDQRENRDNEPVFVASFPLVCIGVVVNKTQGECEKMPGKSYWENFWIKNDNPEETIGQIKAFAKDIGYEGSARLGDIIDGCKRLRLIGEITHSKNQDNPDDPYANLRRDKIRQATAEEVAQFQTYQVPDQPAAAAA